MTDRNEALRLAEWLRQNSSGIYRPAADAAYLLDKQAERIAELESELLKRQQRLHDTEELAGQYLAQRDDATAQRDQLRAEVERLRAEVTAARENGFRDGYEQRHAEVLGALT